MKKRLLILLLILNSICISAEEEVPTYKSELISDWKRQLLHSTLNFHGASIISTMYRFNNDIFVQQATQAYVPCYLLPQIISVNCEWCKNHSTINPQFHQEQARDFFLHLLKNVRNLGYSACRIPKRLPPCLENAYQLNVTSFAPFSDKETKITF